MPTYNQKKQPYTRMACSIYTLLSIMKYNFGITVKDNFIIKACKYLESLGGWLPAQGAVFKVIYSLFVKELNKKLGLEFKVSVNYITSLKNDDTRTYGIGMPRYNKKLSQAMGDGTVNIKEIDAVNNYTGKTYGHNLIWDGSKGGYIINTDGTKPAKCSPDTLEHGVYIGVFWDTIRTIEPVTKGTKQVVALTKGMALAERKGKLDLYKQTNKENPYLPKAIELFEYGR